MRVRPKLGALLFLCGGFLQAVVLLHFANKLKLLDIKLTKINVVPATRSAAAPSEPRKIPANLQYLNNHIYEAKRKMDEVVKFLKLPILNKFDPTYKVAQETKCSASSSAHVVIIVPSARRNFKKRALFRHKDFAKHQHAVIIFFVGSYGDGKEPNGTQQKIDREIEIHKDIVTINMQDVYGNILEKHVAMLNWVVQHCSNMKFAIRFDDDIMLMQSFNNSLRALDRHHKEKSNFILGRQRVGDMTRRDALPKWKYKPDYYPPYLLGGALGYPVSTVRLLYEAAQRIKPVWLDDVYITGICAQAVGIPNFNDVSFVFSISNGLPHC